MFIKKAVMLPIWILQLFTQHKDFRKNPIIGNRLFNRLGLHVSRVALAAAFAHFRRTLLTFILPRNLRRQFQDDGVIIIENFLDDEVYQGIKKEIQNIDGHIWEMTQGNTRTLMLPLDKKARRKLPNCDQFVTDKRFVRLVSYVASNFGHPISFIHCVKNGFIANNKPDPQKTLHTDTFQPTAKYWLFLDDVRKGEGPFVYALGSHKFSKERMKWEYKMSCRDWRGMDLHSATGSFRISKNEIAELGLEIKEITVKANTLVIADTHGFHCRGEVDSPCSRLAIYGSARVLPFNPLPGFGSGILRDFQYSVLGYMWEKAERKAIAKKKRSIWQRILAQSINDREIN